MALFGASSVTGRPASFRGASFFVDATTDEYGRRGAHHEFPGRDRGVWEDLGGKDPVITISAYITGFTDFAIETQKKALITACKKPGAGRLIHPFLGAKNVVCTECKVAHNAKELGRIAFELSFLDADTVPAGASAAMGVDQINTLADALEGNLIDQFVEDFQLDKVASFVQATALGDWSGAVSVLGDALGGLDFGTGALTDPCIKSALGMLGAGVSYLRSGFDLAAFVSYSFNALSSVSVKTDTRSAASQWCGLARLVVPLGGDPSALMSAAPVIADTTATTRQTPGRIRANTNTSVLADLIGGIVRTETARAAVSAPYPHKEAALTARKEIAETFEAWAEAAPDRLYRPIGAVSRAVTGAIATKAADLSKLGSVITHATLPALVLAYRVHGTPEGALDLATRNKIAHPGFVPAGKWEVLQ